MMKQCILILLTVFSFSSCVAQKKKIISHCNKLEGTNTNIRNLIDIDGYYPGIMFFEDGSYVKNFWFKAGSTDSLIRNDMSAYLHSWIDDKGLMQWSAYWGVYRIEGDIIIAQTINPGNFWRGWEYSEIRYKIIDKNTINAFYYSDPTEPDRGKILNYTYNFIPCDSLPTANNPLKEYKWLWRHESDWKEYMQKIEQKKKQFKKK